MPLLIRFLRLLLWSGFALFALLFSSNVWVLTAGSGRIFQNADELPRNATGLVLGTSPRSARGAGPNPFFEGRMDAAARLFHEGILIRMVLSGDNRSPDYNEPQAMREALLLRGVPDSALVADASGIRTLDSIQRARETFQLSRVIIITDDFHLSRALFLASANGLDAVGFASPPVPWKRSYRTRIREWFSRVRACQDVLLRSAPPQAGQPVKAD